jgi:signal transduction histidine kinase
MGTSAWSTQQLAEFVAAVSTAEGETCAAITAVERAAEALDADVAAIVCGGELIAAVGYPEGAAPVDELEAVKPGLADAVLDVPGVGNCAAAAAALEHPPGASLVIARPAPHGFMREETGLLRGMARVASMTMRMLRLLDTERAAREELERLARDQAALRRVATLIARGTAPNVVFDAVAEEVGRVLPVADVTLVGRYDSERAIEFVGGWSRAGGAGFVGERVGLGGRNVATLVHESNAPARVDHLADDATAATAFARNWARSAAGAPINVEGRLWGVMTVGSLQPAGLPRGIEHRLAEFTGLIATAIANAQAREELRRVADEQAALRRVATLVARAAPPEEVFAAVAEEVGQLFAAESTLLRCDPDGTVTTVGSWSGTGDALQVVARLPLGGHNAVTHVFETDRPARIDRYPADDSSPATTIARRSGGRSAVGAPISVEGRLWGAAVVTMAREEGLPVDAEERLADFAELVATAIANAEAKAELTASRARIVASADETRRRIERDLHDGAQQRLVSLALQLRAAQAAVPADLDQLATELDRVVAGLDGALDELREFARGIHPATLAEGGLRPALKALARRSAVPVDLKMRTQARLPEPLEVAAYYVVSEALTNAVKHADAATVSVDVEASDDVLRVRVRDDGVGGADFARGSGLVGLKDRVEALGGRIALDSNRGLGTSLSVELPLAVYG